MPIPYRLNPMGHTQGGGRLPSGYRRVEYLESTGTQYIDTGLTEINDYVFSAKMMPVLDARIFGSGTQSPAFYTFIYGNPVGDSTQMYNGSSLLVPTSGFVQNKIQNIKISKEGFSIDERSYSFAAQPQGVFTTPTSVKLFGYTGSSGTLVGSNGLKIYEYIVRTQQGKAVQNFVPALDPAGRPCMYDLVEQKPYYNEATSGPDFLWGGDPEVELPVGYRRMREVGIPSNFVTDIKATQTNIVRCVCYMKSKASTSLFRAYAGDSNPSQRVIQHNTGARLNLIYNRAANDYVNAGLIQNVDFTKWHDITLSSDKTVFDGVEYDTKPGNLTVDAYWGANGQGQHYWNDSLEWRLFEITDNGRLTHRLLPVMTADDKPALYDTITGVTYYTPVA